MSWIYWWKLVCNCEPVDTPMDPNVKLVPG